jgi:amino acid transporter
MKSNIFISYRREDSSGHAGRLLDRLGSYFGEEHVFIDIDTIQPGADFSEVIDERVGSCAVMLVVISARWLTSSDSHGTRRLDNPDDFVRREIRGGIEHGVTLIPVLVGGASMPTVSDLPPDIADLASKQACELHDKGFHRYVDQMVSVVARKLRDAEEREKREAVERARTKRDDVTRRKQTFRLLLTFFGTFGFVSAYYVVGPTEDLVGKSAPWFIFGGLLLSCALRALCFESYALFGREDLYKVVQAGLGTPFAKLASAALLFDCLLIGPICGVAGGLYVAGFVNELGSVAHADYLRISSPLFAEMISVLALIYCWRRQVTSQSENNGPLQPRRLTVAAILALALIIWCFSTIVGQPSFLPPWTPYLGADGLGWLHHRPGLLTLPFIGFLIGFGHSLLVLTPEEVVSQANELVESKNLDPLRWITCGRVVTGFAFPLLIPFFAVMLIPDAMRQPVFFDVPLIGLTMYQHAPKIVGLACLLVVVAFGARVLLRVFNLSITLSSGVLVRATEDREGAPWLFERHETYHSRHRLIHLVALFLLLVLIVSGGRLQFLTGLYAFGITWSFILRGLALLVLRYKNVNPERWKVPLNFRLGHREIPVGLTLVTGSLLLLACTNLMTRTQASVNGAVFTLVVFLLLKLRPAPGELEQ